MPIERYAFPSLVRREQQREQPLELSEERSRIRLVQHVAPYLRIGPGERSQAFDPVRVRQESAIEEEVDVERDAVLVPEGHDVGLDLARRVGPLAEELVEPVPQLVHIEVRGVDDEIGLTLELLEQRPLPRDAIDDAVGVGERMGAT